MGIEQAGRASWRRPAGAQTDGEGAGAQASWEPLWAEKSRGCLCPGKSGTRQGHMVSGTDGCRLSVPTGHLPRWFWAPACSFPCTSLHPSPTLPHLCLQPECLPPELGFTDTPPPLPPSTAVTCRAAFIKAPVSGHFCGSGGKHVGGGRRVSVKTGLCWLHVGAPCHNSSGTGCPGSPLSRLGDW